MNKISRDEAVSQGLNQYFTGKKCKRGHVAPWWVHSYSCTKCHDLATKQYRRAPKTKEKQRAYYEKIRSEHPERILYQVAKRRAKKLGIPFDITVDDIRSVYPTDGNCPALGIKLQPNWDTTGGYCGTSPSLDRIVPELGYIKGNIAVISVKANLIKNNETDPAIFRRVADWLEKCLHEG
jgi:hypothetical protein